MNLFRFDDPTKKPDLSKINDQSRFLHPRYRGVVADYLFNNGGPTALDWGPHNIVLTKGGTGGKQVAGGFYTENTSYFTSVASPHFALKDGVTAFIEYDNYMFVHGDIILAIEGGATEVEEDNLMMFMQEITSFGDIRYIHEYGAGSNSLYDFSSTSQKAQAVTRTMITRNAVGKTVRLRMTSGGVHHQNTQSYTQQATLGSSTTSRLAVAGRLDGSGILNATIRAVRIWNRALTISEQESLIEAPYLEYTNRRPWVFLTQPDPEPPATADFSPYKTVVDGGSAAWDAYFENVSCVVKFNDTYFLYYIGGDADADEGDDWVHNRQVGVATSHDGVNWTKYGSNPILSFTPEGDQDEEGIGDCKCVVYDGKIHMYYSAIRWRSGGDVDVEIRYRESTDGFTFTNDTLIIDDLDEELYASGVYVTSGGTFHLWYTGPLTGGVGDLKKLSGSDPASLSSDGTITTNDYSSRGGIVPLDADNLLFFNDRFFDGSITCTLIKTAALGALSTVFTAIDFNGGGAALDVPGCFFYENGQWFQFSIRSSSATAPFDTTQIVMRTAPEIAEMAVAASANIAANAATATTALMSAPGGKDTGDFDPGWISDDVNPGPSTDIDTDLYTELEWCMQATAYAGAGVVYEFRVSDNGAALDSYTDLPEWTIESGPIEQAIGQATESDSVNALTKAKRKAIGLATETEAAQTITVDTAIEEAVGLATETEAAHDLGASKDKAIGLNVEADSSLSLTSAKSQELVLNAETDSALATTTSKTKGCGQTTEADSAQDLGRHKAQAIGPVSETDAALAVTARKATGTGLAEEADQALSVSATKHKAIGLVTETETAQGITTQGSTLLGQADETNAVLGLSAKKVRALGIVSDEHSSQPLTGRKVRTLSLTAETDQSLAVETSRVLLQVVETDSGLPIRAIKTRVMGATQETETIFGLGTRKHLAMGLVAETQEAMALSVEPTAVVAVAGSRSQNEHGQRSPSRNSAASYSSTRSSRGSAPRRGRS